MISKYWILTALGVSSILLADTEEDNYTAIVFFEQFSEAYPKDSVLLYSLGKAYYDVHAWKHAIQAFEKSLELKPDNPDAELFLAYALLFQNQENRQLSDNQLKKSQELFEKVLKEVPDYTDAKEGLKTATKRLEGEKPEKVVVKEPLPPPPKKKGVKFSAILLAQAKKMGENEDHAGAIQIYQYLTERFPDNPEYLFFLGREYVRAKYRCLAKEAFERSIEIKPDYSDSLIFLGRHYFADLQWEEAAYYYERAVRANPKDVAGFIGLARSKAALEQYVEANEFFQIGYAMEPYNVEVVVPYTAFLLMMRRYCEAEEVYRIYEVEKEDDEIYRRQIFDTSAYTTPTFYAKAGTAQEREKDIFSKRWVASLRYYNTEVGSIVPISEILRLTPRIRAGTTRQRLLVSKKTQFDVKSVGGGVKAEWLFDIDWSMIADLSMESISNNHKPVILPTKNGLLFEPTLVFRYSHNENIFAFGELADSIIFRDFKKQHVRVVTRNAAVLYTQKYFEDYRYMGFDAAWIWYQDRVHNQEQDATLWFQAGIPYLEDLLSVRYSCEYRHFYHETTGYYSFQYQLTHWLKLRSIKHWLSGAHYELEYWHGWRTTKGRNPQQQIVVTALDQLAPVRTVEYEIDQVFVTIGYMPNDDLDLTIGGTYYHDSFDYTIMGAKIQVEWRF